jgi:hypothetical protein
MSRSVSVYYQNTNCGLKDQEVKTSYSAILLWSLVEVIGKKKVSQCLYLSTSRPIYIPIIKADMREVAVFFLFNLFISAKVSIYKLTTGPMQSISGPEKGTNYKKNMIAYMEQGEYEYMYINESENKETTR